MPLYEYRCNGCRKKFTILVRDFSAASLACPDCGSDEAKRIFSGFSVRKSEQAIYDDILSDSQLTSGLMRDDPRALAEWNKRMSQGTDEEVTPEYSEMLEKMEAGEMPKNIAGGQETSEDQQ